MNLARLLAHLERFPAVVRAAVDGLTEEEVRFRPAEGAWSILEVAGHLADEEVLDFRARLERTLRDPAEAWDPIDPVGWVGERRYQDADLAAVLDRFAAARADSLSFLRGLADPAWTNAHEHARLGALRAGDLLVAWVVHDQLHLRQIANRRREIAGREGGGYSARYAEP
ncbi:MAG: DinB family protein [Planctomycetota bacterium]